MEELRVFEKKIQGWDYVGEKDSLHPHYFT